MAYETNLLPKLPAYIESLFSFLSLNIISSFSLLWYHIIIFTLRQVFSLDMIVKNPYTDTMNNYVTYIHGETGLTLGVIAEKNMHGEVEVKGVFLNKQNILPILSDDVVVDIELFIGDYLEIITD